MTPKMRITSTQAGNLFRIMSDDQKQQLASNIAAGLCYASQEVKAALLAQFGEADADYRQRVHAALQTATDSKLKAG